MRRRNWSKSSTCRRYFKAILGYLYPPKNIHFLIEPSKQVKQHMGRYSIFKIFKVHNRLRVDAYASTRKRRFNIKISNMCNGISFILTNALHA